MHLLIINPNTTSSMTQRIGEGAELAASHGTRITAVNPDRGPAAIQGAADGEAALPGLFRTFDAEMRSGTSYDAVIIACFDDTGLWELKRRSPVPVLGIGEAGFHAAMLLAETFAVVTTLDVSLPVISGNISSYGFQDRCAAVRASGIPVLDLERETDASREMIAREIATSLEEDAPGAIVLGCAGMTGLSETLSARFGLPVIDGVAAAVALAEALVRTGMKPATPAASVAPA